MKDEKGLVHGSACAFNLNHQGHTPEMSQGLVKALGDLEALSPHGWTWEVYEHGGEWCAHVAQSCGGPYWPIVYKPAAGWVDCPDASDTQHPDTCWLGA